LSAVLRALAALVLGLTLLLGGCGNKKKGDAAAPEAPFVVRDASEGLLLTWIDEKGDFHTEMHTKDVPLVGRDAVKVVDTTKDEGTHADLVFVADLRTARADGTYAVRSMTRAQFDDIAVARRQKHGPTLADVGKDGGQGGVAQNGLVPVPNSTATGGMNPSQQGRPAVIVYGASWCGPCHEAAAYLRMKGIPFVEKDVEEDHAAAAEMKGKLQRAGLPGGSIPVMDVRGKILVGFNPRAIDEALGKAT
jgi:glutaredoxin